MSGEIYETDRLLSEYLLFHYGGAEEQMPWAFGPREAVGFPARCATAMLAPDAPRQRRRALDVGCAVGRSSFELARHFGEVTGIDFSRRFIGAAERIRSGGRLDFEYLEEGDRVGRGVALRPEGVDPDRVRFAVGDATDLSPDLAGFDFVLAANLLCRLPDPARFLGRLPALVAPGGCAVLATPCSWMEEFTPKDRWLCAGGRPTLEGIRAALGGAFELARVAELPFLIREHARKFQWGVSQCSLWIRK